MKKYIVSGVAIAAMAVGACSLAGCTEDLSMPQDSLKAQQDARANRAPPGPTELPPGLGEDLPSASSQPNVNH